MPFKAFYQFNKYFQLFCYTLFQGVVAQASHAEENLALIELSDVTVAAEYRGQALSRTPSSIDVIDGEEVSTQHINTLTDMSSNASNLLIQSAETYKTITIRGVGGGGRHAGFDSRAGVYVDGVYMGQGMALDSPIYDVEQIEILKGPQGYLFGNSSDAGAINIVTKQPSREAGQSIRAGVGNFGYLESTLKANGALGDRLAGRLIVHSEDHDGFVRNRFDNEKLRQLWRFGTRGQLKLEATDQLDMRLAVDYSKSRPDTYLLQGQTAMFGQPANPSPVFDQIEVNDSPSSVLEAGGVQLNTDYFFEDDGQFTTILAKRYSQNNLVNDNDYSREDVLHAEFEDTTNQTSQEFRYTSPDSIAWPYVIGLYFLQQDGRNSRRAFLGEDLDTLVTIPGFGTLPFETAFGVNRGAEVSLDGRVKTNTKAIYTNVEHQFNDVLRLHMGGRYSIEDKNLDFSLDGSQSGALGITTLNHEKRRLKQNFFSPMIGLTYQIGADSHVYGKFSRAYKNGGWNVEFLNVAQVTDGFEYAPESVNAYEIGYKYQGKATQFTLAAFVNRYKDYQVFQFADLGGNTLVLQLRNAANVKSQGLELSVKHLFDQHWNIDVHLAYLDARFEEFPNGSTNGADASGQRLPDAPEFSGALTVNYQSNMGCLPAPIKLSVQNKFQSSSYSGVSNDPNSANIAGRNIVNASMAYTFPNQKWDVNFWVRNLTDKVYALAKGVDFLGNGIHLYARPRTYGVYGTYHF